MNMKQAGIKKIQRFLYLLYRMDGRSINLADEARNLGFTVRTLQRDINELDAAGFPVCNNLPGEYTLVEGFSFNKLSLSAQDEALLNLMGQLADTMGENWLTSYQHLRSRTVRPEGKSAYFIKMPRMWHSINQQMLEAAETAILKKQYINLQYRRANRKTWWCNHLRPLIIALFDGFWYLVCLNDSNGYMKFSLTKILQILPQKETFKPTDIHSILQKEPNIWFDEKPTQPIELEISAEAAPYFKEVEFFPHQQIKKEEKGKILLSCRANNPMQVLPQLKRWLPHIRVIKPKTLQQQLNDELRAYLKEQP